MATKKKPAPTKGGKAKKAKKEANEGQLSDDDLSKVSGGITATATGIAPNLAVRQLTEQDLLKVAGGIRLMDQGDKSRQGVCR